MSHPLDRSVARVAHALRTGEVSAAELTEEAIRRHRRRTDTLRAYKLFDTGGAREAARAADERLAEARRTGQDAPPMCGIPVSVKDLYGMDGLPTFAGTSQPLPERWSRDAWLVRRLRGQGAVFVGKTHTVEMAFGAVGMNPHWDTPRNPWDLDVHRIPGGSSSGAGVSLHEGSALVALGSDTGGSIRIPAAMTGIVGHKTTRGRWSTEGVVPLSHTLDTVGALTRTVADSVFFFRAVEGVRPASASGGRDGAGPDRAGPEAPGSPIRIGLPRSTLWRQCQGDVGVRLVKALDELEGAGWEQQAVDGALFDEAAHLYRTGGIAGTECLDFLERELPGRLEILHPIVASRLEGAAPASAPSYQAALNERARLEARAPRLFSACEVLALPASLATPWPVADLRDLTAYLEANTTALAATCPVNVLGLCAITLPVGLDDIGMPVGLQLVGQAGRDGDLLAIALEAERVLGTAAERLGRAPLAGG